MSKDTTSVPPAILLGGNGTRQIQMLTAMANRHGMIAGATGTGKTVTLQVLAEGFSRLGVPVFLADVKGDLSGLGIKASPHPKIDERIEYIAISDYRAQPSPVIFWDMLGELGHPIRTTVSEMGPLLLSSLLELNDTQTGVMYSCFKIADDNGWLLLDFKDLRAMLAWMADHARELRGEYGNIATSSVGAIQRGLLILEEQGAEQFMGEPAVILPDLMKTDLSGHGVINILDVTKVIQNSPRLYATFLLWLISELFENLPEVGDADRPKFVLFFDEAHLLFDDAPEALLDKIERVVRLIRSKGVGVYFISQSPLDIPYSILGQLGLKIQHALRAFTPRDKKAVKTVAETFRPNPDIDAETTITELGTGEALVSCLDEDGSPTPVERTLMRPPESQIGPMTSVEREEQISRSPFKGRFDQLLDRESAWEILRKRAEEEARLTDEAEKDSKRKTSGRTRQSPVEAMLKSAASSFGTQIGRQIMRGILGSIFKGR
jgi:DNA helicase HerA-like ATPase